jgi:hypothetical protein
LSGELCKYCRKPMKIRDNDRDIIVGEMVFCPKSFMRITPSLLV